MRNKSEAIEVCSWLCNLLPIPKKTMASWISSYCNLSPNTIYNYMLKYCYLEQDKKILKIYKKNKHTLWRSNKKFTKYEEDIITILEWIIDSLNIKEIYVAKFVSPYMGRTTASIYSRLRKNINELIS